jgi:hypothetical protein
MYSMTLDHIGEAMKDVSFADSAKYTKEQVGEVVAPFLIENGWTEEEFREASRETRNLRDVSKEGRKKRKAERNKLKKLLIETGIEAPSWLK